CSAVERYTRKANRRGGTELGRGVGAGAPDLVMGAEAAKEHAAALERAAVVHRERGRAERCTHGVAHTEPVLHALGALVSREAVEDCVEVGNVGDTTDFLVVRRPG